MTSQLAEVREADRKQCIQEPVSYQNGQFTRGSSPGWGAMLGREGNYVNTQT